jgi:hypothetical protein
MPRPISPDTETREHLLNVLAELIARSGAATFLLPPVEPGGERFPEPWAPTKPGVALLLRRLLWHAGEDREVVIEDRRHGAPPTERKPATRCELVEVRPTKAVFVLGFIGEDDIVGTLAHEVGMLHAVTHRPEETDPYRTAEPPVLQVEADRDGVPGAVATVYLGLGVLAANAAFQQYSRGGRFNGGYEPLEYDVLNAGALPMSALAYLLAVQAVVRRESSPPRGLEGPQRDEVSQWMKRLDRAELCASLGIDPHAELGRRPVVERFADAALEADDGPAKTAFRWQTNRAGVGFLAGAVFGVTVAFAVTTRGLLPLTLAGGAAGHVIGRQKRVPRCSACATIVRADATTCPRCGARLRGDIATLSERLEAEERLEETKSL